VKFVQNSKRCPIKWMLKPKRFGIPYRINI
jgi:hypothetical protein